MVKQVKLRGTIQLSLDRVLRFFSTMYDGTPFNLVVDQYDVELNEEFRTDKMTVEGWLFVVQEAQQADRCYLTLPKASITHGKQLVVQELQLMPRVSSINDFKPKKMGGDTKQVKLQKGEIVELEPSEIVATALAESTKKSHKKSNSKS